MEKTKLGVSVGLVGAAAFFCALFGGYTPALLVAGYVLLFEENTWLKKTCVKAIALMMAISVLVTGIGLIPDLFRWISDLLGLIHLNISFSMIYSIVNLLTDAIYIVKVLFFLMLGLKALKQENFTISFIDNLVDKYMDGAKSEKTE